MNLFDTHAHFSLNSAENKAVLHRAADEGVSRLIAVGGNSDLNEAAIEVSNIFPDQVGLALGFDRSQAKDANAQAYVEALRRIAETVLLAAVGETGLDFHYEADKAEAQCELFAAHLEFADEWRKPVIIHTREADEETLRVLDETPWHGEGLRGVVHCFTGSKEFAKQLLDRQLAISFSGIVTFRNAGALRESAAYVPDERLLIETDSPYLAPVPLRGSQNEPAFVKYVAECLAEVRGKSAEFIAGLTAGNAEALFADFQPL
ncbi:MAG: TatD family hydrolase [Kiritimatiellia bacterium]